MKISQTINMTACAFLAFLLGSVPLSVYASVAEFQYPDTSMEESSADCNVIYKTTYDFSEDIPKYPKLEVSASGYDGVYDGNAHGIEVDCGIVDAKITYSIDGKKYGEKKPVYTDVGTYIIYYKVEKNGYTAVLGSETVRIREASIGYSSSDYSGMYDGKAHGIHLSVQTDGCKILYSRDGISYSSIKPEYKEAGVYITYYRITKDNYRAVEGSNKVIIGKQTIQYNASDYNGIYDGKPHGITVTVSTEGCEILYSEDGVNYSSRKPEYKEAGTYVTYFKIRRNGYETVTGRGRVVIESEKGLNSNAVGSDLDGSSGGGTFNVQTGDGSSISFFAIMCAASGFALVKLNRRSKGGRKNYEYK